MTIPRLFVAALVAGILWPADVFAARIGTTGSAKNIVTAEKGGKTRSLVVGSPLFPNELVRTGAASAAQLLFQDKTTMTLGANAAIRLDRSVYSPSSRSTVVHAVKGAFRFISGVASSGTYKIKTPVASIGIRGSIVEGFIDETTGWEVIVLVQGKIDVCTASGCKTLSSPGTYITIKPNGNLVGPAVWRGPFFNLSAGVNFIRNELHMLLEPESDTITIEPPGPGGAASADDDGGGIGTDSDG